MIEPTARARNTSGILSGASPFDHLFRLTDARGVVEHARGAVPRDDCGYCVDDAARALVVATREPDPSPRVVDLGRQLLQFVGDAQVANGRFHNRLGPVGRWLDEPGVGDCWGRALWALGTVARRGPELSRRAARRRFEHSAGLRSPWGRSMAFAALGAAEVLQVHPDHGRARKLLVDAVAAVRPTRTRVAQGGPWPWPEPRLRYANAVIPEVLIRGGHLLGEPSLLTEGLSLLEWLLATESRAGHLSVTPVDGWALDEPRPGFDQQPIEAAAIADACATAFEVTGDEQWLRGVELASGWFLGDNDTGVPLYDPSTGGSCDGLEANGRNANQGAESTLALISTMQRAGRIERPARRVRGATGDPSPPPTAPAARDRTGVPS
jgi:hypothetical protein